MTHISFVVTYRHADRTTLSHEGPHFSELGQMPFRVLRATHAPHVVLEHLAGLRPEPGQQLLVADTVVVVDGDDVQLAAVLRPQCVILRVLGPRVLVVEVLKTCRQRFNHFVRPVSE